MSYLVFDLDDTLYKEVNFLYSGFNNLISVLPKETWEQVRCEMLKVYSHGGDPFDHLLTLHPDYYCNKEKMILQYRTHVPNIDLEPCVGSILAELYQRNIKMGLITDGRSITQRNKIKALSIEKYFTRIVISEELGSEKPSMINYELFYDEYDSYQFVYFGDNIIKDFVTPKKLGWLTVCLKDSGVNIHKQDFNADNQYLPHYVIDSFCDLEFVYG